jgi:hypothetical protein
MAAIDAILTPVDTEQASLPLTVNNNGNYQPFDEPRIKRVRLKVPGASSANNGLRAAVIDVLKRHGSARAPNIATILEAQGFPNDSNTPLAIRVYNDLWRLSKVGVVSGAGGVFTLKEGTH